MTYEVGQKGFCTIKDYDSPEYNMNNKPCIIVRVNDVSPFRYNVKIPNYSIDFIDTNDVPIHEHEFKPLKEVDTQKFYKEVLS